MVADFIHMIGSYSIIGAAAVAFITPIIFMWNFVTDFCRSIIDFVNIQSTVHIWTICSHGWRVEFVCRPYSADV